MARKTRPQASPQNPEGPPYDLWTQVFDGFKVRSPGACCNRLGYRTQAHPRFIQSKYIDLNERSSSGDPDASKLFDFQAN